MKEVEQKSAKKQKREDAANEIRELDEHCIELAHSIQDQLQPALASGLREIVRIRPENPKLWLGNYLLNYQSTEGCKEEMNN